ncbi:hypothetical protein BV898_16192 [Hypsibius exemplaris]|uniref:Uncharacterized protein n=1 Tax=Hypsibius exemplaris TaxID=2072580 RepID=A0A9X6NCP5_HYPEX|nr:hypothetical protein BV898_16192 [Hypsibius exemplaris]
MLLRRPFKGVNRYGSTTQDDLARRHLKSRGTIPVREAEAVPGRAPVRGLPAGVDVDRQRRRIRNRVDVADPARNHAQTTRTTRTARSAKVREGPRGPRGPRRTAKEHEDRKGPRGPRGPRRSTRTAKDHEDHEDREGPRSSRETRLAPLNPFPWIHWTDTVLAVAAEIFTFVGDICRSAAPAGATRSGHVQYTCYSTMLATGVMNPGSPF